MMRGLRLGAVGSLLLLMTACGSSSSSSTAGSTSDTSTTAAAAAAGSAQTIDVALTDFMIEPMTINAKAGAVTFHAINNGKTPHNFDIKLTDDGDSLAGTKTLNPGQSGDATATLTPGTYVGYCAVPGHESLGMKINVVVS